MGPTGSAQSGTDPEHERGGQRYQRKQDRRPGHQGGYATGNNRGDRREDTIHEPKAAADEVSSEDESGYPSGDGDK
jgi:hypothetical protein